MSTSGSTTFTMNANEIVEKAFHILGKSSEGEAMTARMYQDGRSSLNLLCKTLGAREHLWLETAGMVTLVADTQSYALTPPPMQMLSVRRTINGIDTPMRQMSRQEYDNVPNKQAPSSTPVAWYYDKQRATGTLYLWPAPVASVATAQSLKTTYFRTIQDVLAANDEADLPQEWLQTLVWQLANDLETEYPVNDVRLAQKIERKAEALLFNLSSWDTENASIYVQPEYDPWIG